MLSYLVLVHAAYPGTYSVPVVPSGDTRLCSPNVDCARLLRRLCVNGSPLNSTADFSVSLAELGITSGGASVRDIWKLQDAPPISAEGSLEVKGLAGHSSRFFRVSPNAQ